MPDPTSNPGAPIAYRAITVAELTSRLDADAQTALIDVVRSAPDTLSVEQLLRREGWRGVSPRTRRAAGPTAGGQRARIVAPPPLHSTGRAGSGRAAPTRRPHPAGFGPRAGRCSPGEQTAGGHPAAATRRPSVP